MEFQEGDKVRLKLLGPVMSIKSIKRRADNGGIVYIECVWVSPKQKYYCDRFTPDELVLVERALLPSGNEIQKSPDSE